MPGRRPARASWRAAAEDDSAFVRLWLGFATARASVGVALLLLLLGVKSLGTPPGVSDWLLGMCATYLLAALTVRLLVPPPRSGHAFDPQWVSSIGVDLLVFSALQLLQAGGIYFAPLFALPVLMAAALGSTLLALGTAAAVTLLLLAEAWVVSLQLAGDQAQRFLQAGLTGTGYFALAFLVRQLAERLAREEEAARVSRKAARMQVQVNQLVMDTLVDGVLVVDPDGQVHAANPAARELLGAPAQGGLRLAAEPAWDPLVDMARHTFLTGQSQSADLAVERSGSAARQMFARTRLTPSQEPGGDSLCVVFLQDLREMEARMRTEKLAAMGRMSTAVAHEIRNPLAAISQANALLAEELVQPSQLQLSTMVSQNAQRLAQIVEEILDVARVQHQAVHLATPAVALDDSVRVSCDDWTGQTRSGERVVLALSAPASLVAFEPDHLRRVLVNLLDNALRYASQCEDAIQVATGSADAPWLVVWSDGARLEDAVERHLFEPFFSSESRSSGLGLYICRELCERHGARITYGRSSAPAGDRRDGNAFSVSFRTATPEVPTVAFARMAA